MVTATGAAVTSRKTTTGTKSGYGQVASQAGASWPATTQSTIGAPDGNGWLYDTTALEGQQIVGGVWTAKLQLTENNNNDFIGTLYCLFSVYNSLSNTFTLIGTASQAGITFSTVTTTYTLTSGSLSLTTFGPGDKLCVNAWINITTPSSSSLQGIYIRMASSSTQGVAGAMEIDTPGVQRLRTIPATVALLAQRTIPCTAALQPPGGTRSIGATAALLATQTRTVTATGALQATLSRTIPATGALLLQDNTRTILATSALLLTQQRTIPAQCALSPGIIRIVPATGALSLTSTRMIGCTASLTWPPFTRFPTVSRRTGSFPFAARRTGEFPTISRRES